MRNIQFVFDEAWKSFFSIVNCGGPRGERREGEKVGVCEIYVGWIINGI